MDEVATTLFSLGNYSRLIPLNNIIEIDTVLRPLQYTPGASASNVVQHLLAEDNHPPTYFVLAHWWMQLFHWLGSGADGYGSLWVARSLSALFGALAVPGIYLLAWLSCRDRLISQLSALIMVVSPLAVFLSQEARHYTLGTLAVIASLCCFVTVYQALQHRIVPGLNLAIVWIAGNIFGLSVHYFFGLTVLAQGLTLLLMLIQQCRREGWHIWQQAGWVRVYATAGGTLLGTLLWLPVLLNFYGSPQTSFLKSGGVSVGYFTNPILQSLAGWYYTVLSPVTNGFSWQWVVVIVISCVLLLGVYAPWLTVVMARSLTFQFQLPQYRSSMNALGGFFIAANVLFFLICYGLGFDITRGHRYTFVFSPSLVVLIGMGLAPLWRGVGKHFQANDLPHISFGRQRFEFNRVKLPISKVTLSGRTIVVVVIAIAFIGSQFIVFKRSNLKFYKADRLIRFIQAESSLPVVIADSALITPQPIVIGLEMMAVGWEIHRDFNPTESTQNWQAPPQFLLVEKNVNNGVEPETELKRAVRSRSEPFDLWLLGGYTEPLNELGSQVDLTEENCAIAQGGQRNRGSFPYTHYICTPR